MHRLARLLCLLCSGLAGVALALDRPAALNPADTPLQEIAAAESAFVRAAALPAWADLLELRALAPTQNPRPADVRLVETQLLVGPAPVRLIHRIVQVNDAFALEEIGQLALEFNPNFERLLLHKVLILRGEQVVDHTLTARVRFLQREAKLEQGLYSGLITASIVLPRVHVGDTLQLVYSVAGENPTLDARYTHHEPWDRAYPVALRRVTLVAPTGRRIHWRWFGGSARDGPRPTETLEAGAWRMRFEQRDVAGAVTEPLTPPSVPTLRGLQFSEYTGWNEVARWALALFPLDARLPAEVAPVMARLRTIPDPAERASQALQWVQTEIRHWAVAVGECAMRPQLPAVVVERGWGDCKDKALLLAIMLRELAIDARPALASLATRAGPASMLPAPDVFDHVVVQVRLDGREYYLDPTRHGQAGLLSRMGQRLEEAAVLPVDADTQDLVIVRSPNRPEIFRNQLHERLSLASFGAEGQLEVDVQWVGVNAETLRLSLQRMDAAALRSFAGAGYLQQYAGSRLLGEPRVHDDRRLNQLTISARFAVPRLARAEGDQWAVAFAPSLGDAIVMPPTLARKFPLAVNSFPTTYHYRVDMAWPEGTTLPEQPALRRLDTPHFRLLTTRTVRGNLETRTVQFESAVSEVPAAELFRLAQDLDRLSQQIGGVMLAPGEDRPQPASARWRPDRRKEEARADIERR